MTDLERGLRSLADRDDLFPETPDLAAGVAAMIGETQRPRRRRWPVDRLPRMVAIVLVLVVVMVAAALAVPRSRSAIADFFGIEGIRIVRDDAGDVPDTPTSIGGSLLLGEQTTLDAAIGAAPFAVTAPQGNTPGAPAEVWLNRRGGATVVGLIWPAGAGLPEIGETGVGMLLLEIKTDGDDEIFIKKMISGGEMEMALVGDNVGIWIENGVLAVEPVEGMMADLLGPEMRRSGNVLIWSDGEITYRLETLLPQADAVRLASSLAPVRPDA